MIDFLRRFLRFLFVRKGSRALPAIHVRYEHMTLSADSLPSAEQLDELAVQGWLLVQVVPATPVVFYFRREVPKGTFISNTKQIYPC